MQFSKQALFFIYVHWTLILFLLILFCHFLKTQGAKNIPLQKFYIYSKCEMTAFPTPSSGFTLSSPPITQWFYSTLPEGSVLVGVVGKKVGTPVHVQCTRWGIQSQWSGTVWTDMVGREVGGGVQDGGTHVYLRLTHVYVWQKKSQCCNIIFLQLK